MAKDEDGVVSEIGLKLLQYRDPVFNHRTGGLVDEGIFAIEYEIAAMHDVRFLKMNNTITIGVSRAPVLNVNGFIAYLLLPSILVSHVRVELIGFVIILFSGIYLVDLRILVSQD